MKTAETEYEIAQRVEALLGSELTGMLRAATEALERLAPNQFEAIGTRALNLDTLMINASAAAALPELMARFRVVSASQRAHAERYGSADWAQAAEPASATREDTDKVLREVPQDRFPKLEKESSWAR